ncbi:DUF1376 domain-containing protein [Devosia ginsengisoli]|uniref:YdaU family protein n=1 Tax=Devosia ginsengisoli TaxID=400770 RepID=UPI0026F27442|nr:DUF1376 domain-containing protein [Devosia ginsengisoli]MCR6671462.1 DUF1376 domain-containing protein [Devosia ginsengisoli]
MAQFPALPLWTDAYLADTGHLTTLEHGAYLMLLMSMWRAGGDLPNDDRKLARFAKLTTPQWQRIKDTIMEFMTVSPDGLTVSQGRLGDELQYVRDHSKKQAKNSRQRWGNRTATPGPVGQHSDHLSDESEANPMETLNDGDAMGMPNASQTDAPTPTPNIVDTNVSTLSVPEGSETEKPARKRIVYPDDFETAWQAFPTTPNMSKAEALPEWKRLSPDDRAMVLPSIAGYRAFLKANPAHPAIHFCRYLSKRRFEGFAAADMPVETEKDLADPIGLGPRQAPVAGSPVGPDPRSTWLSGAGRPTPARRR